MRNDPARKPLPEQHVCMGCGCTTTARSQVCRGCAKGHAELGHADRAYCSKWDEFKHYKELNFEDADLIAFDPEQEYHRI